MIEEAEAAEGTAEAEAPAGVAVTVDGFVPLEVFTEGFVKAHQMAGVLTGLQSLQVVGEMQREAAPAAKAVYDILRDWPAAHWLIKPESVWAQRLMAIGIFAGPVYLSTWQELRERRREARAAGRAPKASPPPANDNRPARPARAAAPDKADYDPLEPRP